MAKKPSEQQKTDAKRIAPRGSGKLDQRRAARAAEAPPAESLDPSDDREPTEAGLTAARQRIERERRAAIDRLRQFGGSVEGDDDATPGGLGAGRDEGDQAQASEQTEMALMTRERLAERIERLTAALERVSQGQYGRCGVCGRQIAASRLAAIPETETCVSCQEQREGRTPGVAA